MAKKTFLALSSSLMMAMASYAASSSGALNGAFSDMTGDEQVEFVATVNKSFAASERGLDEKRVKTLSKVNRDAVMGAPDEDRKRVLAEVFATAPMEALPTIVDDLAQDVFHRDNNSLYKTDEEFTEFASAALMRTAMRLKSLNVDSESPGARSVLAVTMFLKAAGEKLAKDLREPFIVYVLSGTHVAARDEYLPAAMGDKEGEPATMAPITNAGYRAEEPNNKPTVALGTPEIGLWTRSELSVTKNSADNSGPRTVFDDPTVFGALDGGGLSDLGVNRTPRSNDIPPNRRRRRHEKKGYDGQIIVLPD